MDDNSVEAPPVVNPQFNQLQELGLSLDQDGHLDEDVACRKCDYNLRGLALDRNCPECETAIEQTINRSTLRFSDPIWLRQVRSGLTFMLLYIFSLILMNIFIMVAAFGFGIGFSTRSIGLEVCITIYLVVLLAIQVIAYMRMTTLESTVHMEDVGISSRRLARLTLIASIIAASISLITDSNRIVMFFSGINEIQFLIQVSKWTGVLSSVFGFVGMFALFVYARSLALRCPDDRLAKRTRLVMWGYMIPAISYSLSQYARQIISLYAIITIEMSRAITIVQYAIGIPALVFGIWAIVLLFKYRGRFSGAMNLAA